MIKIECKLCGKIVDGYTSLDIHLDIYHIETNKLEYYKKYNFNVEIKKCKTCGEEKFIFLYHKDKYSSGGYKATCIECNSRRKYPDKWVRYDLYKKGLSLCSKCGETKKISEFHKDKKSELNITSQCKSCREENQINYIKTYGNTISVDKKVCSICGIEKDSKYFSKNSYSKDGLETRCKDCVTQYRIENREHLNNKQREYYRHKLKTDKTFIFWQRLRKRFNNFLKNKSKSTKLKSLLGYSFEEFKNFMINNPNRIQKGFTFENYLNGGLTLDHIIPLNIFKKTEEDYIKATQFENLRLITQSLNSSKNNKIDLDLIKQFNLEKLYYEQLYSDFT